MLSPAPTTSSTFPQRTLNADTLLKRLAIVASILQDPSNELFHSNFTPFFSILCDAALQAPIELLQHPLAMAGEQSTIIPTIVVTLLFIIPNSTIHKEDVRHKALNILNTLLKRLPPNHVESVLPGLSTRLCALCFTNFNLESERFMFDVMECLFDTWFLFHEKYRDKFINLLEIIYGKYEGTIRTSNPRLQHRLLQHLQKLHIDDHELGFKLLLMFAADGFNVNLNKPQAIVNLTMKHFDKQTMEARRIVLGAIRVLWPDDIVPKEFSEKIVEWSLDKLEQDNRKLVLYRNHEIDSILNHMARNDNSLSMRILTRFTEAENANDILKALTALRSTIIHASNPAEIVDTLMQQHDWLVGERDAPSAPWDDMIPVSICLVLYELCVDRQKVEPIVPYFLPFLLSGLASEHDKQLQEVCNQTLNVLFKTLNLDNLDSLLVKHSEHLLQILSVQLACPFAYPLCPRIIGLLSKHGADEASINSLTRRILNLLEDAQQLPAYAHILITSLNDCVTSITRHDSLLLLWDTVIPYTWSDDPSIRSMSLSVITKTMLKFEPNDEQILNKLHLSWPSLLAMMRQCQDYQDTLKFTLLMLSRAPDFLSQRYVKEWWPILKAKPRSKSTYLAIRDAFMAGLHVHADTISEFFNFVEKGLEEGMEGAMEAFNEMELKWNDYGWFIRHHSTPKYFNK